MTLLFNKKETGVLLHPTSLPEPNLGRTADIFLEWLKASGASVWQILPMGPPVFGRSPYQSLSSFAINPELISKELLREEGLLENTSEAHSVALKRAADKALENPPEEFFQFRRKKWVKEWGVFMALKDANEGSPWHRWNQKLQPDIKRAEMHRMLQFFAHLQWRRIRKKAFELGIRIIGDLPVYPAQDSADVYFNRKIFKLFPDGTPSAVAGVPPDYFSRSGQLWGNPVYDWEACRKTEYKWWEERLAGTMELADMVRIDHFRGFDSYWEIPADAKDAIAGRWCSGPGIDLFNKITARLGKLPVIAEDLGLVTPEVVQLREECGFPGMVVLQFALEDSKFNPDKIPFNSVVYTGTHDNDTTAGWIKSRSNGIEINSCRQVVDIALNSPAALAVIPMQDILELGSSARMNTPSTDKGNWCWKLDSLPEPADLKRVN